MNQDKPKIENCRECPNFLWDFETGRFHCEGVTDRQVEHLHLIPDWCPQAEKIWASATSQSLDAASY